MDKRIKCFKPERLLFLLIGILLSASLSAHYNIGEILLFDLSGAKKLSNPQPLYAPPTCPPNLCVYTNTAQFVLAEGEPAGGTFSGTGVVSGNQFNPLTAGIGEHTITYTAGSESCTFTIAVSAPFSPGSHHTTKVDACVGFNPTELSITGTTGKEPFIYQWYINGTEIGSNQNTYDHGQFTSAGIYIINCKVTDACGTFAMTDNKEYEIVDDPTISITGAGQYCKNSTITLETSIVGGTGDFTNFKWFSGSTISGPWTEITGETNPTFSPSTSIEGSFYYRVVVDPNVASCNNTSDAVTITILELPTATINGTNTICEGNSTNLTFTLLGSQPWSITYTDGVTPATITGIASSPHTITVSPVVTTTYTLTAVNDANCSGTDITGSATITVDPTTVGGNVSGTKTICSGSNSGELTLSGHTGSIVRWESSTNDGVNWNNIAHTGTTYTSGNLTQTTWFRAVVQSGVCSEAPSGHAVITVDPPTAGGTVSGTTTVCSGSNSGELTLSGHTGSILRWESSTNDGVNWTNITHTGTTYTSGNLTQTTWFRAVVQSGVCSEAPSGHAVITVDPPTAGGTVSGTATICSGSNSGELTLSGHTGSILRWESSTNDGTNWTNITHTGTTYTSENLTQTTWLRAVVQSGVCPETPSGYAIITVDPTTVGGNVSGTKTICSGSNSGLLTLSGHTGTILRWESSTNDGVNWNNIAHTGTTYTSGNLTQTTWFRAVVKSGVCPEVNSTHVVITVNPIPTVDNTGPQSYCPGVAVPEIVFTGTGTSYTWTNSNTVIGLASSGTGNIPTFTPVNAGNTPISATITVTPVYSGAGVDCLGTPISFTITVNPAPTVAATPLTQTICPGGAIAPIIITNPNNVSGTTFSWTRDNTTILTGIPASGTGATINGNLSSTEPQVTHTTIFTITATAAGCATSTTTVEVTVLDNTPPTFTPPNPITVYATTTCETPVITPNITGNPVGPADNCTLPADPFTYTDSDRSYSVNCAEGSTITRTWTLTDAAGNTTTHTQIITIADNIPPSLTIPANIEIDCSLDPEDLTITGMATATDNCSTADDITITYVDSRVNLDCPTEYDITRTWTATDCSGNARTNAQTIRVRDNIRPTILNLAEIQYLSVPCPSNIPIPDISIIQASDNCENITIEFMGEEPFGLEDRPGYCPTRVHHVYRIYEECKGTYTEFVRVIDIEGPCGCSPCAGDDSFFTIDLMGQPAGSQTLIKVVRKDKCCTDVDKNDYCISVNLRIDPGAVGIEISIDGASPSPMDWRVDCNTTPLIDGNVICIPADDFHLFTYCKPGGNANNYTFRSIAGVVVDEEVRTRVSCNTVLSVSDNVTNPVWNSVFPGTPGQYNHYLDVTDPYNPIFFASDANAPSVIHYQVCGGLPATPCVEDMADACNTVVVYVLGEIYVEFDRDPGRYCLSNIPEITATVYPGGTTYTYEWFDGPDATGTLRGTTPTFQPLAAGEHSIRVRDIQSGVLCSELIYNFMVAPDDTPPEVFPPADLYLECNNASTANLQLIADWRSQVTAIDDHSESQDLIMTDSYVGITQFCDNELTVTFYAEDECGNIGSATAKIIIQDTTAPEWLDAAGALDRTVECTDTGALDAANALFPVANDNCESGLVPVKTSGTPPTGVCLTGQTIINTWVVTDACGNISATYTQTITIEDDSPPYFTYCPPNATNQAEDNLCLTNILVLEDPIAADDCGTATITWVKSGATLGTGTGTATGPFNVGVTTITYTATDACDLTATCIQLVTIVDVEPPEITCPSNITVTAPPPNCELQVLTIPPPTITDNCNGLTLTLEWEKTGATIDTGTGDVNNTTFNVGVTTVTYTVTDAAGNTATCSFTVTVNDEVPPTIIECIATPIEVIAPAGLCEAPVTVPTPTADDPCGEIVSITHNSLYGTDEFNASGTYPVGIHTITWTILDASGNTNTLCVQVITVQYPHEPDLTCPPSFSVFADTDESFASGVVVPEPTLVVDCADAQLSWVFDPPAFWISQYDPADFEGNGTYPPTGTFWLGTSTITYTATDKYGNTATCSFTITVDAKPEIVCPANITVDADAGECDATRNPGVPSLVQGAQPITWTWSMLLPDGTVLTGGSITDNLNPVPDPIVATAPHEYAFPVGTTTITWTATNLAGADECIQTIIVTDTQPPVLTPPDHFEFCVENLFLAFYNGSDLDINPDPDHYLFRAVSTDLDLDMSLFSDNCCLIGTHPYGIRWEIDFDGPEPSVAGTGQPSAHGIDIELWGDGITHLDRVHTITYWVTDCHGIETGPYEVDITIKPRPQIIKN